MFVLFWLQDRFFIFVLVHIKKQKVTYRGYKLELLAVALLCLDQFFGCPAAFPLPALPLLLDAAAARTPKHIWREAHRRHDTEDAVGSEVGQDPPTSHTK